MSESLFLTRIVTLGLPEKGPEPGITRNKCVKVRKSARISGLNRQKCVKVSKSDERRLKVTESAVLRKVATPAKRLFPEPCSGPGIPPLAGVEVQESSLPRVSELSQGVILSGPARVSRAKSTRVIKVVILHYARASNPEEQGIGPSPSTSSPSVINGGGYPVAIQLTSVLDQERHVFPGPIPPFFFTELGRVTRGRLPPRLEQGSL